MGLIIKGTIPRVPAFSPWNLVDLEVGPTKYIANIGGEKYIARIPVEVWFFLQVGVAGFFF